MVRNGGPQACQFPSEGLEHGLQAPACLACDLHWDHPDGKCGEPRPREVTLVPPTPVPISVLSRRSLVTSRPQKTPAQRRTRSTRAQRMKPQSHQQGLRAQLNALSSGLPGLQQPRPVWKRANCPGKLSVCPQLRQHQNPTPRRKFGQFSGLDGVGQGEGLVICCCLESRKPCF